MKSEGGYLISQIHQLGGRIFDKKLKAQKIDINPAQGRIIFALWKKDAIPINDLATETALSKSALTTMLERLEKSGHIERKPSEKDARSTLVCLTEKSSEMRKDYQTISKDMTTLFYQSLKKKEIMQFEETLKKILENLKNEVI